MTPMVDLVFMMNIYFMVTWLTAALAEIDLPAASHCRDQLDEAVVVTIKNEGSQTPRITWANPRPTR